MFLFSANRGKNGKMDGSSGLFKYVFTNALLPFGRADPDGPLPGRRGNAIKKIPTVWCFRGTVPILEHMNAHPRTLEGGRQARNAPNLRESPKSQNSCTRAQAEVGRE